MWRRRSSLKGGSFIGHHNMNGRGLWSVILIFTPQLGIGLHQGLLADGILDLHLRLSSYINA